MNKNDGGPAFPRPIGNNGATNWEDRDTSGEQVGMSLRDYFAGQALAGMLAAYSGPECSFPEQHMAASRAFEYADAMLSQRDL